MQHAAGAGVLAEVIDAFGEFCRRGRAASVKRMEQSRGGRTVRLDADDTVPEGVNRNRGGLDAFRPHLFDDLGKRAGYILCQRLWIYLPAAVFGCMRLVLNLRPEAGNLLAIETIENSTG